MPRVLSQIDKDLIIVESQINKIITKQIDFDNKQLDFESKQKEIDKRLLNLEKILDTKEKARGII